MWMRGKHCYCLFALVLIYILLHIILNKNKFNITTMKSFLDRSKGKLPICSSQFEMVRKIKVIMSPVPKLGDLELDFIWVQSGGHYSPPCRQEQTVAIILPYRKNNYDQLFVFLRHMHPFLKKQQLDYTIFVIEQRDLLPFNRGALFNAAFLEARKQSNFNCFIFHETDVFPEDLRITYNCTDTARHMISTLDAWHYKIPYSLYYGGAISISGKNFETVNGFSNRYWGTNTEYDDFTFRLYYHDLYFEKYPENIGSYKMYQRIPKIPKDERHKDLGGAYKNFITDGLVNARYTVKHTYQYPLYTRILVEFIKD